MVPVWDPVFSIVEIAGVGNVDTVIVGGVVRKKDGKLTFPADVLRQRQNELTASGARIMREVEEVLLAHAGVAEVSVVGRKSDEWGEEVIAFVVAALGSQPSRGELDALCLGRIARFKRPKEYRFVESLPKNNYGKVLKTELRKLL